MIRTFERPLLGAATEVFLKEQNGFSSRWSTFLYADTMIQLLVVALKTDFVEAYSHFS